MIPSRTETIRAYKAHGGRVAAVLPAHYPRSLFRAFDILPVEVWGPPGVDPAPGASHVQPYVCSLVRNALSFVLAGGADVADILLVPHTCDSLQGLGSILLDFVRPAPTVLTLYLPRGQRATDHQFLANEIRALYRQLAEIIDCQPTDAELMASVLREEQADGLLGELYRQRRHLPFNQIEFYRLVRSREFLPAELFSDRATAALARAGENSPSQDAPTVTVVLSGIVPEPMELLTALETRGAFIVDDFLCCGRRVYPTGTSADPFERMAERILGAPPDSTRGAPVSERVAHLVRLTRESSARGVVFYDAKFCEPELFYLPTLRKGLKEAGIPSTVIEMDLNDPLTGPVLTRLEAFLEMFT